MRQRQKRVKLSALRKISLKLHIIDFMLLKRFVNEAVRRMNRAHTLATQDPPPGSQIEAAYRRLRDDIISGMLAPSEKLRIEHLRQRYGMGASALREALSRLVSDGLVECEAQRGYWVSPVSRAEPSDSSSSNAAPPANHDDTSRFDALWAMLAPSCL